MAAASLCAKETSINAYHVAWSFGGCPSSLSYVPQVKKALPRGSTKDLSLKTLAALAIGLALWIVYGVFQKDIVIAFTNGIGISLVLTLIGFKLRISGSRLHHRRYDGD